MEPIQAPEFETRLSALCTGGVGPGLPRKRRDLHILLRAVSCGLEAGTAYSERDITSALREWLAAAGPRVETDAVTLRRALIDHGYALRDDAGDVYRKAKGSGAFAADVPDADASALLERLRKQAQARRSQGPGQT